jgi:DNA-binding NarL/FixJ family response regulator
MSRTVVLADDHTLVREALRRLIESELPDLTIAGETASGSETLSACREKKPDILVLDIAMPDLGGMDVLSEIRSVSPRTRVAVVSQYSDRAYVIRALQLGAKAYVPKKALARDLITALRSVMEGRTYLDPSVADVVVDAALRPGKTEEAKELDLLTRREREVLRLVAEGRTAKEIARILTISVHTVNRHRANLMEKLDIHSTAALVKLAIRLKLVEP